MRITGLLAVLLFLVIVLFAAPAASHAQTAPATATTAEIATPKPSLPLTDRLLEEARHYRQFADSLELERDGVCYTMRTYVMAREDRDSDTTHMVRYTRCLPAWKLQFKSATEEPQNRREK